MIKKYFILNLRWMVRDKTNSMIKFAGLILAFAITLVLLVYTFNEFSYDRFHTNAKRIYRIIDAHRDDIIQWSTTPYNLAQLTKSNVVGVHNVVSVFGFSGASFEKDGQWIKESKVLCTRANFFDVFSFPLELGSASLLDSMVNPIIINSTLAEKYFPNTSPTGKPIRVNISGVEMEMTVIGVMKDFPKNSSLKANMVLGFNCGLEILRNSRPNYTTSDSDESDNEAFVDVLDDWKTSVVFANYVLAESESIKEQITDGINREAKNARQSIVDNQFQLQPLLSIYTEHEGKSGFLLDERGNLNQMIIFPALGIIVLIIALINLINLSLAQNLIRDYANGIRMVCGAGRHHLFYNWMVELSLLSVFSLPFAILLAKSALPNFTAFLGKSYFLSLFDYQWVWLIFTFLVILIILIGSLSLSKFRKKTEIVSILNGTFNYGTKKNTISNILMVFQISSFLILFSLVVIIFSQVKYSVTKDLGFNKENLITIPFFQKEAPSFEAFKQRVITNPNVISTGGAWWIPPSEGNMILTLPKPDKPEEMISIEGLFVGEGFDKTLQLRIVEGESLENRDFGLLINQTAAKNLGLTQPIGMEISFGTIIGVVEDFHLHSVHKEIPAMMIVKARGDNSNKEMVVRISGKETAATLHFLKNEWKSCGADIPFEFHFMDDRLNELYKSEIQLGHITGLFAMVSIFLALIGLFGINLQNTRRKVKEIGIRKVNGAGVFEIVFLINRGLWINLMISFLISTPFAVWLGYKWLDGYAYRMELTPEIFVLSGMVAFMFAALTVSIQSYKAAAMNPVKALRYE